MSRKTDGKQGSKEAINGRFHHEITIDNRKECNLNSV